MNHLSEEQLILHYYGEQEGHDGLHLEGCEECRGRYRELQRLLNVVDGYPVPERSAGYEAQVWKSLANRLPARRRWLTFMPAGQWAAAAGIILMLVATFYAGRLSTRLDERKLARHSSGQRGRVLLTAVGNHLEQSQMLLTELASTDGELRARPEELHELIEFNRLYRMSAAQVGERAIEDVLDGLERLLLELDHTTPNTEELRDLRRRVVEEGLLFKVRVIGSELRERQRKLADEEGESL